MLAGELKDPRLAVPLIVTEVRVAAGMRTRARVRAARRRHEAERAEALKGLKAASKLRPPRIGRAAAAAASAGSDVHARQSEEYGQRIDELLKKVNSPGEIVAGRETRSDASSRNALGIDRRYELKCPKLHNLRRLTESLWSINRAAKPRMTWSKPCGGWSASGRSGIWARSIRWRRACWCWRSDAPRGWHAFMPARRKRYTCAVRFGFATDTYDADGEARSRRCGTAT